MKEILPVPVALAKPYLKSKQLGKFLEAYKAFYNVKTDIDAREALRTIDKNLQYLPKDSEPFVNLEIKYYQLLSIMADVLKENWKDSGIISPEADQMKMRSRDMLRHYTCANI